MVALPKTDIIPLEFLADTKTVKTAVGALARVADRRSTIPLLANVSLRANDRGVAITATDLNQWLTVTIPRLGASGMTCDGACVNAKAFADLVKKLPGSEISMAKWESGLSVSSGSVKTTLVGMPSRDFPKTPTPKDLVFRSCDGAALRDMLKRATFSVCRDETRFQMCGVLVEWDGCAVRMVSTDGHRLTKIEHAMDTSLGYCEAAIVPLKSATELTKLLTKGECEIAATDAYLVVRQAGWELTVKLIDAQFPPYNAVIPKESNGRMTVAREPLLDALKRIKSLTSETRGVRLDAGDFGRLKLTADHPELGTATETIPAEVKGEMAMGFNPAYLIDALSAMTDDDVQILFSGELDPAVIKRPGLDDFLCVVMPMRI